MGWGSGSVYETCQRCLTSRDTRLFSILTLLHDIVHVPRSQRRQSRRPIHGDGRKRGSGKGEGGGRPFETQRRSPFRSNGPTAAQPLRPVDDLHRPAPRWLSIHFTLTPSLTLLHVPPSSEQMSSARPGVCSGGAICAVFWLTFPRCRGRSDSLDSATGGYS